MRLSFEPQGPSNSDADHLVDRLVDGELPEVERREFLQRLDSEPDGWRRCALAFLEAQSWREAFMPLTGPALATPTNAHATAREGPAPSFRGWQCIGLLTGLAAGLAVAFALGWTLHGASAIPTTDDDVASAEEPVAPSSQEPRGMTVAELPKLSSQPDESSRLEDQIVKEWEWRGYQAAAQERLVSLQLSDGRKLQVPVQEVRLRHVGIRTY
jgi:hypothetical protein